MEFVTCVVLLVIGFLALVKGADIFVEGSASIARRLKVPSVVVGLTIVAMGTSAPELAVSVSAGLSGSNAIAISNVVGSNLFNILVVLGICALFAPITVDTGIMKRDFPFSILITLLMGVFIADNLIGGSLKGSYYMEQDSGIISRFDGIILLILFIGFMILTVRGALKSKVENETKEVLSVPRSLGYIVLGLAAIIIGGNIVVENAKALALMFGMSETLVGLTIVAVGTSLPELVTSVVASRKGENGIAVGNVVGSNIFNILLILGTSGTLHPIAVTMESMSDVIILVIITILAYLFALSKKRISKAEGGTMVALYAAYMIFAIVR